MQMLARCQVRSLVMAPRILGCPHEEGVDYPEGSVCPSCPFWAGRDRWAGSVVAADVMASAAGPATAAAHGAPALPGARRGILPPAFVTPNPMSSKIHSSPFAWNAGGWFGALFGSTIWMLALGVGVLSEDRAAAGFVFTSFVAANLWGILLWRRRARLSAYAGLQWLMVGLLVAFAVAIVTANARSLAVQVPYWAIALPVPLMAMFWLRQRFANGALRVVGTGSGPRRS
jgi:hypothetical protein